MSKTRRVDGIELKSGDEIRVTGMTGWMGKNDGTVKVERFGSYNVVTVLDGDNCKIMQFRVAA